MTYATPYFRSVFQGVGQIMPLDALPQTTHGANPRAVTFSAVCSLENMLLTSFRKLAPFGLGDGRIRVLYKDAALGLTKAETMAKGENTPSEVEYRVDGSEQRHTFRQGMTSREMREVTAALLAEIEARPEARRVLAERIAQKQKGDQADVPTSAASC